MHQLSGSLLKLTTRTNTCCRPSTCRPSAAPAAFPLLLPPGEPNLPALLELVDGLILSGGGDIDPLHYGSDGHPAVYMIDPARDEMELALARQAAASDLPTLGVCRGAQLINVALGGTLVEHLPDEIDNTIAHRMEPRGAVPHPVTITPGSHLAEVIGAQAVVGASWHHQAIRTPGLRPAGGRQGV